MKLKQYLFLYSNMIKIESYHNQQVDKLVQNTLLIFICLSIHCVLSQAQTQITNVAGYISGDFHQHTTFSDGSYSLDYMMAKNRQFELNWWANSEHGGGFARNGLISGSNPGTTVNITYWDSYVPNPIIGTVSGSPHQNMWRWQSLRDSSFAGILKARVLYPEKIILQSYEMNIPGFEHGSMGLIANQFDFNPNANSLAQFEFTFDANDADQIGGTAQGWVKSLLTNSQTKAIEAIRWLNTNYPNQSYLVINHPERRFGTYSIAAFRDMNNAAPNVCFGFEGIPGHQKATLRGGYSSLSLNGGTFGGAGYFSAKVGGLWDALLTEGRNWWIFTNSDCHNETYDFYPGEYAKNYTYVNDKADAQSIVDGLRSGNTWIVTGDLIDSLDFSVFSQITTSNVAFMGQKLHLNGNKAILHIKVHDQQTTNNNIYSGYSNPQLNHIDIIAGVVRNTVSSVSDEYNVDSVTTTKVIARFGAAPDVADANGIPTQAWTYLGNGWVEITLPVNIENNSYFRLRGTNLGLNIANETDAVGNPLPDSLLYPNNAEKAFNDLWFYSNPIFVIVDTTDIPTASIFPNQFKSDIQIVPNPTSRHALIQSNEIIQHVNILTVNGQLVYLKRTNSKLVDIDMSRFSKGAYLFVIQTKTKTTTIQVIKQ
jgi:hypothetical protein